MTSVDFTQDPAARSWVESAGGHSDFPVQNLPLGVFAPQGGAPRGGMAIGDDIIDIAAVADLLDSDARSTALLAGQPTLNALLDAGAGASRTLRRGLFGLLIDHGREGVARRALHRADQCTLHLPVRIGDYTDFYTGIHHAVNVGKLFRPDNPLLPNYKYVPIGYHGRASSVRLSGADVRRPNGQTKATDADRPVFGPSKRLDYELEMAVWIGRGNDLGEPVPIDAAYDHIAGLSILNDWSARDIQAWEYQPLGPFLAKNFHSSISPWIVTLDAFVPFRTAQPARPEGDPAPLAYLLDDVDQREGAFAVTMDVLIRTGRMRAEGERAHRLSRGSMAATYWTVAQLVAHHASNGCNLQVGDLLGSGTLSSVEEHSKGSLLELSNGGGQPIALPNGETRTFLEDGDEIIITAFAEAPGYARIGFGTCSAVISPAP